MTLDVQQYLQDNLEDIVTIINKFGWEAWMNTYPPNRLGNSLYTRVDKQNYRSEVLNNNESLNLYVHVPFCISKCDYCPYYRAFHSKFNSAEYISFLKKEIDFLLEKVEDRKKIQMVYFGGGTPTILQPEDFEELFRYIDEKFDRDEDFSALVETTPYHVTPELAQSFVRAGIDSVTIGVQSFNEDILEKINRPQKVEHVYSAVKYLRDAGVKNVYFDIIVGLDGQSPEEFKKDTQKHLDALKPDGYFLYPLQHYEKHPDKIKGKHGYRILDYEKIHYTLYSKKRWERFEDIFGIGYGARSYLWYEGQYISSVLRKMVSYDDYMMHAKSMDFDNINVVRSLPQKESFYKVLVRKLFDDGLDLKILEKLFGSSSLVFKKLEPISHYVLTEGDMIFLDKGKINNYGKTIFSSNNTDVNYFIFCFLYLYSTDMQELLIKQVEELKKEKT